MTGVVNINDVMLTPHSKAIFQNLWSLAGHKGSPAIDDGVNMMNLYDIIEAGNNPTPVTKPEADKECVDNAVSTNAASSSRDTSRCNTTPTNDERWGDVDTESASGDEESERSASRSE